MTDTKQPPEIVNEPHYRYPDWPGKTTIYFSEGYASLENEYDGKRLSIGVGYQANNYSIGLQLHEAMILRDHLDTAITEQEALMAKEAELTEPYTD